MRQPPREACSLHDAFRDGQLTAWLGQLGIAVVFVAPLSFGQIYGSTEGHLPMESVADKVEGLFLSFGFPWAWFRPSCKRAALRFCLRATRSLAGGRWR